MRKPWGSDGSVKIAGAARPASGTRTLQIEYVVHGRAKDLGDLEAEAYGGVQPVFLDRQDGLAGDLNLMGKIGLAQVSGHAQFSHSILQYLTVIHGGHDIPPAPRQSRKVLRI